jgi:hypothetical protein
MLYEQSKIKEIDVLKDMKATAATLNELVNYFGRERDNTGEAIRQIIFAHHPVFAQLAKQTTTHYRVYFTTYREMASWLNAKMYKKQEEYEYEGETFEIWLRFDQKQELRLIINMSIFDNEGRLKGFTPAEWNESFIVKEVEQKRETKRPVVVDELDDDIPF